MEEQFTCSRLIREEFEDLIHHEFLEEKLSYTRPTCSGYKGSREFTTQQVYDIASLLKKEEKKRMIVARAIFDSTRLTTQNLIEREQIKRKILEERTQKFRTKSNNRSRAKQHWNLRVRNSPFKNNVFLSNTVCSGRSSRSNIFRFRTKNNASPTDSALGSPHCNVSPSI